MSGTRLTQFELDIARAKDLAGLGQSIGTMTHGRVDASDLYRAALVQAVAALDHYVHGIVLDRGVEILMGRLSPGAATKVGVPFRAVQEIVAAPTGADRELAARTHLAQRLALETYQRPDDIGAALAMVGISKIWSLAFPGGPKPSTTALGVVVGRRNRIVHQCDADPLTPGSSTPITADDAIDGIKTVQQIVTAMDSHC
jgi:hypothetical protein